MEDFKKLINTDKLPRHIAIIMDGNGRWAKNNGKPRAYGHICGVQSVRTITEAAAELGIEYLTVYAFSTENWNRPEDEVKALMSLLASTMEQELPTLIKNDIRLTTIGDANRLPVEVREKMQSCIDKTAGNKRMTLNIALSYSSRWEITAMAKKIAGLSIQEKITPENVSEDLVSSLMCTADMPDPELLIRTSGEYRISNFLLWQIAYSELYFTDVLWPDFGKDEFYKAIVDYQKRERRFGKTTEQVTK